MICLLFCMALSRIDAQSLPDLALYKGVWDSPPANTPSAKTPDGPIAGNGDIGLVLGGTPGKQVLYLSKNDFWKAQPGYPDGGVCLPGGLTLQVKELANAACHLEQHIEDGTIQSRFIVKGLTYRMKAWVAARENLVVIECSAEGMPCEMNIGLWAKEGFGSVISQGKTGNIYWAKRKFDTPGLEWPTDITLAMKILGVGQASREQPLTGDVSAGRMPAEQTSFRLVPGKPITLAIRMVTNHEVRQPFDKALQTAASVTPEHIGQAWSAHIRWWKQFWSASSLSIGDTMLEKYYYGSQYLLASCSRNKEFPPGLWGNSLTTDASSDAWEGDYHTNYNYQAPWWGAYSSNHIGLTDPYDQPILEYMKKAQEHARTMLHVRGVYYPVGIGPKGFCSSRFPLTREKMLQHYPNSGGEIIDGGYMFLGQKSDALFLTANMFMRFYSTYDSDYARKIYPFLRQTAFFWEDWLKLEKGRYMSYDDSFWEVGPWEGEAWRKDYGDINPTISLGLLRMFFKGIQDVSSFLRTDASERQQWKQIAEHLSPIPTVNINGMIRIKACEGGAGSGSRTLPGFGRVMMHGLVFPSGACGIKTDSGFARLLRLEIGRWGREPMGDGNWDNLGNGLETYFTSAARLGVDPDTLLQKLKERIAKTALPNLCITQEGGGIETLSAVPSCLNEMLLQGYEGILRVFPDWPSGKDASFTNLRAYGAFLVSAVLKDNAVANISITSEKGRPCILENPWRNRRVLVKSDKQAARVLTGTELTINTMTNERIVITLYEKR